MPRGTRFEYFNVRPRYTPGSPAMVDERIARQVIAEERNAYSQTMTGCFGAAEQERADREGLHGIVEEVAEHSDHWLVHDLLSQRFFVRLFLSAKRKNKSYVERCPRCVRARTEFDTRIEEPPQEASDVAA